MKNFKNYFAFFILLVLIQNGYAISKPIPGVGIVVKKNPGTSHVTFSTGTGGQFTNRLEEGVYVLAISEDQLSTGVQQILNKDYATSNYTFDGSGVELVLNESLITIQANAIDVNRFAVTPQNEIMILVPKGGATFSGTLSWNDAILTHSRTCPDGYFMQNGVCVPNENTGNPVGKPKGKGVKEGNSCLISVSLQGNGGSSTSAGVSSSFSFNPSLGVAITWKNFGIGLDAGTFNTKPNFDFGSYAAPLQNLDYLNVSNSRSNWSSVYVLVGPHYEFSLSPPPMDTAVGRVKPFHNKTTLGFAFLGGVTMTKAPGFLITDTSTPQKTIASYTAPDTFKPNVLTLKPSMTFTYWISDQLALQANVQYLMQFGQSEFTTMYRDLSAVNFNLNPQEVQSQIVTAPKVISSTKGPDQFMSFGFGIKYCFRKGWDGTVKGSKAVEIPTDETQRKGWDGTVKGSKAVETPTDETQRKGWDGSIKGNKAVETPSDETQRKGWDGSIKGNKAVEAPTDETQRKGWDGSIKGNKAVEAPTDEAQRKGWDGTVKGSKAVEAPTDEAQRKGWDGTVKGSKAVEIPTDETQRKGWDGSIKGNKAVETPSDETQRKGWDGSVKGNRTKNNSQGDTSDGIVSIKIKVSVTTKVSFFDCDSPGSFFCIGIEIGGLHNNQNPDDLPLGNDEFITNSQVELVDNTTIKVTSTGLKSAISEKTMSDFSANTQQVKDCTLDENVINEICNSLHLHKPNTPVVFKAIDQKYEVITTGEKGKEHQILKISQNTKISIDGKEYGLSMVLSSGKVE